MKHRIIESIDRSQLVTMKFSLKESKTALKWEHAKEFEYLGEMYDVVEQEIHGDTVYYWLWWDHKETALNQRLNLLLAGIYGLNGINSSEKEKNKLELWSFAKKLFCQKNNLDKIENQSKNNKSSCFAYLANFPLRFPDISGPPPK